MAHWKIGIAFGEVYTVEHDYFGNAINVASRLQALAGPGEIYFTGAPAGIRVPDAVAVHDLGLKALKNIDQTMHVHRAVVPAYGILMQTSPSRFSTTPTLLKHLRKPVIRLEPFRDLSQAQKSQMFGEALVGEVQLILSRLSNSISVTDPSSVALGKQDYILSGSVQVGGSYIRVDSPSDVMR